MSEHHRIDAPLECREAVGVSPGRLTGTILPFGRVAGDRPELFVSSGVQTPSEGVALLPEHRSSTVVMRFEPLRTEAGLEIDHLLPDTPEAALLAKAVRSGDTPGLSVEFHPLEEARVSGVRELRESLIVAVATVPLGSYDQSRAEVRQKQRRVAWWRR